MVDIARTSLSASVSLFQTAIAPHAGTRNQWNASWGSALRSLAARSYRSTRSQGPGRMVANHATQPPRSPVVVEWLDPVLELKGLELRTGQALCGAEDVRL